MTAQPLVSIVIPTHNRADLMVIAAQSALQQTYPRVEVIVVDDGSTDDTPAVVQQFGTKIRYIRQENAGVSVARNLGFAESHGDFICFMDDDDIYFEDKVALQLDILQRHPEAPAANGNYYYMSSDGKLLSHNSLMPVADTFRNLLLADFIWMSAPMVRREKFVKAGMFDPAYSLGADVDLWLRMSQQGDFVCVQKPIGAYRIHLGSLVTKAALAEYDCIRALHRAYNQLTSSEEDQKLKRRSEAQWRIWLATNYLMSDRVADFQRNLKIAAELDPELFADRAFITKRFSEEALGYRVLDARATCTRMFEQLPPELNDLRIYQDEIAANVDVLVAIKNAAAGTPAAGQRTLAMIMESRPVFQRNPQLLKSMLIETALTHSGGTEAFFKRILATVPSENQRLMRMLKEAEHDVGVWEGFVAYQKGHYAEARSKMLSGLVHRPSWLKNRGVASVFVRSFFAHG